MTSCSAALTPSTTQYAVRFIRSFRRMTWGALRNSTELWDSSESLTRKSVDAIDPTLRSTCDDGRFEAPWTAPEAVPPVTGTSGVSGVSGVGGSSGVTGVSGVAGSWGRFPRSSWRASRRSCAASRCEWPKSELPGPAYAAGASPVIMTIETAMAARDFFMVTPRFTRPCSRDPNVVRGCEKSPAKPTDFTKAG